MSGRAFTIKELGFDPRFDLGPDSPLRKQLRRPRSPKRDLEHQYQVAVFEWARANEAKHPALHWLFAVPNWFGVKTAKQGARAKAEGRKAGVPDVWLPIARGGYHGLVIEMKAGENTATHDQRQWLSMLETHGWRTWIAYSAADAQSVILDYLNGSANTQRGTP